MQKFCELAHHHQWITINLHFVDTHILNQYNIWKAAGFFFFFFLRAYLHFETAKFKPLVSDSSGNICQNLSQVHPYRLRLCLIEPKSLKSIQGQMQWGKERLRKKTRNKKRIDLINQRRWKLGEMVRKTAAGKINGRKAFNFNWTSRASQL